MTSYLVAKGHLQRAARLFEADGGRSLEVRQIIERTIVLVDELAATQQELPSNVVNLRVWRDRLEDY